jgi:hypothetical protein
MFDVFYIGKKPGLFPHEQSADSIEHAQQLSRTRFCWIVNYLADYSSFDFLYEPKLWEANQRHAWPSQHQKDSETYLVPKTGYTDTNYHSGPVVQRLVSLENWTIPDYVESFDYSWHPDPAEPLFVYEFATEWHDEGGPVYTAPGATQRKYITNSRANLRSDPNTNWHMLKDCEWDYSWRPHPLDPPYIYVFGNQWWPAVKMPTVEYHVPGATQRKYMELPRAVLPENPNRPWYNVVESNMDYSWVPDPGDSPYTYVFGNQWWPAEKMPTVEYRMPGATERKYVSWPRAELLSDSTKWTVPDSVDSITVDYSWVPDPGDPPYIYQFGTQWQRTGGPVYTVPGATEVKYIAHPRSVKWSKDPYWTVPNQADTTSFDWTWHPDSSEPPYIYQFGTQHQRTGGPVYTVPGAIEVKYVEQIKIRVDSKKAVIYEIDHLDGSAGQIPNTVKRVRYFDNYRDTLIRLAKSIGHEHEFVWVCSSVCNYKDFDFSWHPEQWQATMLHVFASDGEKFGDTFFMHVPTFAARAERKALLEWYDVNFVPAGVPRRPIPVIQHSHDSQVDAVKSTDWSGPLALFTTTDYVENLVTVPLWREQTKTIVPLSKGATSVVVPKTAIPYIKKQLYDYPHIDKTQHMLRDHPLDIVFISNGEPNATHNFNFMNIKLQTKINSPRVKRVDGVNGRVAAYHAAAEASTTPWFFAVFAKLEINPEFNFDWQPDRMQQPKHYVFHARNPVNDLEYGHQAMIAYNKKLVLENTGTGLDFTLDSEHEVVPMMSGIAYYNYTAWMAWRTAFREALKLRASLPDVENEYRLNIWLTKDKTPDQWSQKGAQDAVEYYEEVKGNFDALRLSYEWKWLSSYAFVKRGLTPDQ